MGHKIAVPIWLTIFFIVLLVFGMVQEHNADAERFVYAQITSDGITETVTCWTNEEGSCYVFLPSYAKLSETKLDAGRKLEAKLEGNRIAGGYFCGDLSLNTPYALSYAAESGQCDTTITFVQSANVPTIYIDVASGSMEYIHADKEHKESGTMRLYSPEGLLDYQGVLESIKGRGNGTWALAKKPYNLVLTEEKDLLGMGKASNWVLLTNGYDPTNLRNKIAYDVAAGADMLYTPGCEWVDVYLNGEYAGLYCLCERIEVHTERIQPVEDIGFLVSLDFRYRLEEKGTAFLLTDALKYGSAFRLHEARMDTLDIQRALQSAENAVLSDQGIDQITGKYWWELLDADSWVKKYLLEEVLGNFDAGAASQYFFYRGTAEDGKLYAGPAWDYDSILGRKHWQIIAPNAFTANRPHILNDEDAPYYHALYEKPEFYKAVTVKYKDTFQPLLQEMLGFRIQEYRDKISQASFANEIRWKTEAADENIDKLCEYLKKRLAFLDRLWVEEEIFCYLQACNGTSVWACYAVERGGTAPENLKWQEKNGKAWYDMETGELFDLTQPIWEDTTIYLKNIDGSPEENPLQWK